MAHVSQVADTTIRMEIKEPLHGHEVHGEEYHQGEKEEGGLIGTILCSRAPWMNDWFGVWFLAVDTGWLFQDSTNDCSAALIHGAKTQLVQAKQANFIKAVQLIFLLKPQVFDPFIVCVTRSYNSWDTWMLFYHVAPNVNIFAS